MSTLEEIEATYVVVGGGIAGISCIESLKLYTSDIILLISETPTIKIVTNVKYHTKLAAEFDVEGRSVHSIENIKYIIGKVISIDSLAHIVYTNNSKVKYKKLCLCTGATPKLINNQNYVIGLRDTHSVEYFQSILGHAKEILIIGNGGIATDLVYKLNGIKIIWVIKDDHISSHFLDAGAAEFFSDYVNTTQKQSGVVKRHRYKGEEGTRAALGPDWHSGPMFGNNKNKEVIVEYMTTIERISKNERVKVELANGKIYECDFVVSATGVVPNNNIELKNNEHFLIAPDGGIKVNWKMETNIPDVFAAGDVCTTDWKSEHWFQMRLWSQARQMGMYSAKCMYFTHIKEEFYQDFSFELFTHVTCFFGFKVILLGLYNAQGLNKKDCELLVRVTKGHEYIKLVLEKGKVVGAMLIGNSDLEEMCENLILNKIDVTNLTDDLLDPNIDIDDYFD
ncbi:pyridine nucleotide-disulfide oxidoreductase domain-containing protein 1 [Daktulosphaira vitifoliae]|uniref:pyridine nucleotide-disulfide oxidoreductase domain-containing protein 1 n=1 Tax=Daktulosphaira vitifoliae TaxID=58002 RepID=UPI0021AA08C1|nr:pyridine nucleotide-disulfide oxidoreductase domain-containing protein 1 [Daktulosphaira vitifoliae]